MTKKDIIRKLTSRKFWLAVVGFVTALLATFGVAESTATQVTGLIMAAASIVSYIIGEGLADSGRTSNGESEG